MFYIIIDFLILLFLHTLINSFFSKQKTKGHQAKVAKLLSLPEEPKQNIPQTNLIQNVSGIPKHEIPKYMELQWWEKDQSQMNAQEMEKYQQLDKLDRYILRKEAEQNAVARRKLLKRLEEHADKI